ncbi:MAG: c-type cytochrome [Thermodesulfobacteriota bacterium]
MDVKWERAVMARRNRVFAIVSIILLLILIVISFRENTQEWMGYQKEYYRRIAVRLNDPGFRNKPLKIEQIWLTQLRTTDRCTTCHLGVNNPLFTDEDQPFRTHPGDLLKAHPIEKYGCTVCHQGDGQAVTVEATHGTVHHLNRQLLVGDFVQVSCVKCHMDLHDPSVTAEDFPAPTFFEGRRLSFQFGCRACHNINGEGGILGPELTGFGSKTELAFYLLHYFDYVEGPHTMAQWEYEHFLDPQKIQPGNPELNIPPTVMPNFGISPEQAEALTIYMISLRDPTVDAIPYEYISKKRLAKSN